VSFLLVAIGLYFFIVLPFNKMKKAEVSAARGDLDREVPEGIRIFARSTISRGFVRTSEMAK
jgi:hypothetical protein